jgi:competence protein ComEC
LANVVLGPLMFVALAAGVATVIAGWIANPLAVLPGMLCEAVLQAMRGVIEFAAAVPYGHHWLPAPPTAGVMVFYAVLAASLWWRRGIAVFCFRLVWIIGWILIAHWICTQPAALPQDTIEATFVDVGHGTSVVLRFGRDDVWLYDCGRLGNDTGSSRDIDAALWSLGVCRLQGIFLSHADADHYNALPGLLRRFTAAQIITPPGMLQKREGTLAAARQAIQRAGVPLRELCRGDQIVTPRSKLNVRHPPGQRLPGSDNANSLVLQIDHAGKTLLLPGDLEPPGTQMLINQPRPPAGGVLMAPHHGSVAKESRAVLQWSRPRETVVSGGRRAMRMEVEEMLAITGSGVFVTAKVGAIRVRLDPNGQIELRTWRRSPW